MVRLIDHAHVDERIGLFLAVQETCQLGRSIGLPPLPPLPPRAQSLEAGDDGETGVCPVTGPPQSCQRSFGIQDLGVNAEASSQFALPFLAQHRWTQHQQFPEVVPGSEFRPQQPCLDRLPEANFVRNQDAPGNRVQETNDRLELVSVEVRARDIHAVDNVGESSCQPGVGEGEAKIQLISESPALHQVECILFSSHLLQLVAGDELGTFRELDL